MKNRVLLMLSLIFVTSNIISAQTTQRTITNMDLEKYKAIREKADADYRENYKKLGMPSPEELEQHQKEDERQREELSQRLALEKQQNAGYYQAQANDLRNQIISVDAQINYLSGLISNTPNQNSIFVTPDQLNGAGVVSYGFRGGNRGGRIQTNTGSIATNVQAARNAAASAPNPYYGTPLYQTGIKAVIGQNNNFGRGGYRGGYYGGYPYVANNNYNGRDGLISQLQYLQQVRAGLMAQWNQLDEDARRAGFRID